MGPRHGWMSGSSTWGMAGDGDDDRSRLRRASLRVGAFRLVRVHILASDAVTSGIRPNYITMDLNLPSPSRGMSSSVVVGDAPGVRQDRMAVISGTRAVTKGANTP